MIELSKEIFLLFGYFSGGGLRADKDKEEDFESSMGGGISFSAKTLRTQARHGGRSFLQYPRVFISPGGVIWIFTFFDDFQVFLKCYVQV